MASFRGALLSFNGGCAIIGRNTNFITGNGYNSIAWVARNGLPRSPTAPCAKTNLPVINWKPLTTLACKRFPILSFRNIGKGRVDVYSLWNSGVGLQTNRSLTSQPSKSIQLPVCIGRTSRASEISVSELYSHVNCLSFSILLFITCPFTWLKRIQSSSSFLCHWQSWGSEKERDWC